MQICVNYENIPRHNKTHHNAHNSYGASSTMKHDGFHLGLFATSFARNGINHSTKSSQVCWLVMTQAMGTLVQWCERNLRWTKSGMIGVHLVLSKISRKICQQKSFFCKKYFLPSFSNTLLNNLKEKNSIKFKFLTLKIG
jgi:hypothetical protein